MVVAGLTLLPASAGAQSIAQAQRLWGELRLPGSCKALRHVASLGMPEGRLDAACLLDLVRAVHYTVNEPRRFELVTKYLRAVDELQALSAPFADGLRLPDASTSDRARDGIRALVAHLGLRLRERRGAYTVELNGDSDVKARASWFTANGVDVEALAGVLNAGTPAPVHVADGRLPLPLPEFWMDDVFAGRPFSAFDIVADRQWALVYYGLVSLDDDTLAHLRARPAIVHRLRNESPGAFAAFGRSIRIRGGVLQIPGGADAAPIWHELVGRAPGDVDRFVIDLLGRDDGRLAYFYDLAAHLDGRRRDFLLGATVTDGSRVRFVRGVYDRFPQTPGWIPKDRPFFRPAFDAAVALAVMDVNDDGLVTPAWWPALLDRVAAAEDWPAGTPGRSVGSRPANAAWLLEWLFASPGQAAARFRLLRYAQRQLAAVPQDRAVAVEMALRTMQQMPALALSLERMGVSDPEVVGEIGRTSRRMMQSGSFEEVAPWLLRWQATVSLVEQAQRRRRLPAGEVSRLLRSLAAATPANRSEAEGALPAWFIETLLPAFVSSFDPDGDVERAAIEAFSGGPEPPGVPFSWEGLEYSTDPSRTIARQTLEIRRAQPLPRLQHLLQLGRARARLEAPFATVEALQAIAGDLSALDEAVALLPQIDGRPHPIVREFRRVVDDLKRISRVRDLPRAAARTLPVVRRTHEAMYGAIVGPIAYALAVVPTEQPMEMFATAWADHSYAPSGPQDTRKWTTIAWEPPRREPRATGGLLIRGAYLGIDAALAESRLPTPPLDPLFPTRVSDEDRHALIHSTAMGTGAAAELRDVDRIFAAMAAGRARADAWIDAPATEDEVRAALVAAGADEWRAALLRWVAWRDGAAAVAALRAMELYRLGGGADPDGVWGAPSSAIDGCLCRLPVGVTATDVARGRVGLQGASIAPELTLRLATRLHEAKLPLALLPDLLPAALAEWVASVHQMDVADGDAFMLHPARLPADYLERSVLRLIRVGIISAPRPPADADRN